MGEVLYNGIVLPDIWPPRYSIGDNDDPIDVPYLRESNIPDIIPIDIGRQLFVDDFLIESTDMEFVYHEAVKYEGNPVLYPSTNLELGCGNFALPCAAPKSGGVWWDDRDKIFKMWYEAGWLQSMAYAVSKDGIHWERPELEFEKCSNRILPSIRPDSSTVWIDEEDDEQRYKLFLRSPGAEYAGIVASSKDGIHWENFRTTNAMGDRSTIFYNPFRRKWVYSIRAVISQLDNKMKPNRVRDYYECDDLIEQSRWDDNEQVRWLRTDCLDVIDPDTNVKSQLYNVDCMAYESIILGMFQIHKGPENRILEETGVPKITELIPMYSRDGFHFSRPSREPFIKASRSENEWDRGYVQSVGGVCVIVGDELWFYYTGFAGDESKHDKCWANNGMYANGATGIAKLRRDGFVSLHTKDTGDITTRKLLFSGKYLFVNVKGSVKAEILDENSKVIEGYSLEDSIEFCGDSTKANLYWASNKTLETLANRPIKIRFYVKNGELYSFWVSQDETGESRGYKGAGELK